MQSTFMHMCCQARQLDSYSTARNSSTARQLDRPRQTSTELDRTRRPGTLSQPRQARQSSTGQARQARQARPRQRWRWRLDSVPRRSVGASTAVDSRVHSSTARAQRAPRHACPHQCTQNVFARSSTVCTHLDILNPVRIYAAKSGRNGQSAPRRPLGVCRVHSFARLDPRRLHRLSKGPILTLVV